MTLHDYFNFEYRQPTRLFGVHGYSGNLSTDSLSIFQGYESAILNVRYNIAAEPSAYISVERNGKTDFIRTKLAFDNIIPTIYIATSFKNFEKLIFKGNYSPSPKVTQLYFTLSRNDENIVVFDNTLKANFSMNFFQKIKSTFSLT